MTGRNCLADTPEARVRLAAATSMASSLVHEVNEPLTAASNYLSACARRLRDMGEGHEDVLAMLDQASAETLKAGEIIRRTRNFVVNGKVSGKRENLRTIVERAVLLLNGDRREEVAIETRVPLDLYVKVDRIQIEQLLATILLNACEALAGGAAPRIVIEAARQGEEIVTSIADNGPGLSEEALARLFDPVFASRAEGVGFGLAIGSTIAEAHGGRVWAGNGPDGGAVFHVALPAAA